MRLSAGSGRSRGTHYWLLSLLFRCQQLSRNIMTTCLHSQRYYVNLLCKHALLGALVSKGPALFLGPAELDP